MGYKNKVTSFFFLAKSIFLLELAVCNSDAFTHGPTGPGPRGPLKILDLEGPELNCARGPCKVMNSI